MFQSFNEVSNKIKLISSLEASSRIFMRIWCEIPTFQQHAITFQIKRKINEKNYFATFHAFFSQGERSLSKAQFSIEIQYALRLRCCRPEKYADVIRI
jgi:hypothetical protein